MAKAKHLLDQFIARQEPVVRRAFRTDRMGNTIGDGSYHVRYDVFDIPNTHTRVVPSSGTESVYVKYCRDNDELCLEPITVRYSNHDNNAVRFGEQIDGRLGRKNALDEVLTRLGKAAPKFEKRTFHHRNPLRSKVTREELEGIDRESIPTYEQMLNGRRFPDEGDVGKVYRSQRGLKKITGFDDWDEERKVFLGYEVPDELKYLYDFDFLGGM